MGRHKKHKKSPKSGGADDEKRRKKKKSAKKRRLSTSSESEDERRRLKKAKKLEKKKKRETSEESFDIPLDLMGKSMAPMTKAEWEKRQSVVKRVYDESTGRHRLIKGDGEVIEEVVSRDRHKAINQQATKGDGAYFQARLASKTTK